MNCDAIITSYNENSERLIRTINACLSQTVPFRKIIVVDDGSTELPLNYDGLINFDIVELLFLDKNKGISAARNSAIVRSDADFIACLNVDILVEKNWLELLSKFLVSNSTVGAVFGKMSPFEAGLISQWRMRFHEIKFDCPSGQAPFAPGHAVLFRKQFVDDIGGYDERLRLVAEDSDISERLIKSGYGVHYLNFVGVVSIQENSISLLAKKHIVRLSGGRVDSMWFGEFFKFSTIDFLHRVGRNVLKGRFLFLHIDVCVYGLGFLFYCKRKKSLWEKSRD